MKEERVVHSQRTFIIGPYAKPEIVQHHTVTQGHTTAHAGTERAVLRLLRTFVFAIRD